MNNWSIILINQLAYENVRKHDHQTILKNKGIIKKQNLFRSHATIGFQFDTK